MKYVSYLIVVAHPDDEVLGAGGTIAKLSSAGKEVNVCILSGKAEARRNRPNDDELYTDMKYAISALGIKKVYTGDFSNIAFNVEKHLSLVQFIESVLKETRADIVFTHHPADSNNDHYHTSIACQAAVRLFQRTDSVPNLKALLFMEVPSATDWALNSSLGGFKANTFVAVGIENIERKISALTSYRGVMREFPHPRCEAVLKGLAACRGAQAGTDYAEAFECIFRSIC